jgi:hypothetical protein
MHAMENGEEASRREPGRETSGLLSARTSVKKLAVQPQRSGGIICPLSDSNWKRLTLKRIERTKLTLARLAYIPEQTLVSCHTEKPMGCTADSFQKIIINIFALDLAQGYQLKEPTINLRLPI